MKVCSQLDLTTGSTGMNEFNHSKSEQHHTSLPTTIIRSKTSGRVYKRLIKDMEMEIKYWRSVITLLIDVLCDRGLVICGNNEIRGSVHNDYLEILELLSKYDSYLERH